MSAFLLDENISLVVAEQIRLQETNARIHSIHTWKAGHYLGVGDEDTLQAAFQEKIVLVTFDQSSLRPLLKAWGEEGSAHGGVLFIDERTIANNDYGGHVKAILAAWRQLKDSEFTDGVLFLRWVE
ncbi:MAG TPA: DUF5615 family PIN-like protein [Chthonomonadales bacterium]|nr:DUF5615 family PIN-like protein [Chthonomonadales bacterium]